MNPRIKNRDGFSLLELLIYMSVLSMVVLFVSGSFISVNQGRGRSISRTDVSSSMRFALDQINQDIRLSTSVSTPHAGKKMTCDATHTSPCLVVSIGPDTITYDVSSSQIRRKVNSGTASSITPSTVNISLLTVEYFGNSSIPAATLAPSFQVSIAGAYNSTNPDYQYSETKQATFAPILIYTASARGTGSSSSSGSGSECFLDPILGTLICL